MVMSNEELSIHMCVLKIENYIASTTVRDVNVGFRKLALVLHPDKTGDEYTTAAFQKLRDSFEKIIDHFKEKRKIEVMTVLLKRMMMRNSLLTIFIDLISPMKIKKVLLCLLKMS